jgi:PTH1 family peptidyl-tRNA hydrolase
MASYAYSFIMTKLIIGLGNPGQEYAGTRHNVGFWVVTLLSRRHHIPLKRHRYQSRYGAGEINRVPVVLAQPMTYMNNSGQAAQALLKAYHLKPQDMLVVYDDFALKVGTLRLRPSGSAGGQGGMRSIMTYTGTQEFPRLRLGVGPLPEGVPMPDFVLSPFEESEKERMRQVLEYAADAAEAWLTEPIETVMSQFNRDFELRQNE